MSDLANYHPRPLPGKIDLIGKYVRLEPLDWDKHGDGLARTITGMGNDNLWTHIPFGPFEDRSGLQNVMGFVQPKFGWETMVIIRASDDAVVGMASFMRIRPEHGSAELGCIVFSKELQRTAAATETIYLMSSHLFDNLSYRRNEWKCNNNNAPSKKAALRFGFKFEGIFRNDMIVKNKNRDTAWFAMTDSDWPQIKSGFEDWLNPANFDANSMQRKTLVDCR